MLFQPATKAIEKCLVGHAGLCLLWYCTLKESFEPSKAHILPPYFVPLQLDWHERSSRGASLKILLPAGKRTQCLQGIEPPPSVNQFSLFSMSHHVEEKRSGSCRGEVWVVRGKPARSEWPKPQGHAVSKGFSNLFYLYQATPPFLLERYKAMRYKILNQQVVEPPCARMFVWFRTQRIMILPHTIHSSPS